MAEKSSKKRAYVGNAQDIKKSARTASSGKSTAARSTSTRSTSSGSTSKKSPSKSGTAKKSTASAGTAKKSVPSKGSRTTSKRADNEQLKFTLERDDNLRDEIGLIVTLLICVLMVLSYLNICGKFGNIVNTVMFGMLGSFAYVFPFVLFAIVLFAISNKRNSSIVSKTIYCFLIVVDMAALIQLTFGEFYSELKFTDYFTHSLPDYFGTQKTFGGFFGGGICKILCPFLGNIGTGAVLVASIIILLILIVGKAIFTALTRNSAQGISNLRKKRREEKELRQQEYEEMLRKREAAADPDEYEEEYPEEDEFDDILENDLLHRQITGKHAGSRRSKNQNGKNGFIDTLMRKGMGLDLDRIENTDEYRDLKESYGQTEYEMGEIVAEEDDRNEIAETTPVDTSEDLVQRELDKKFGDKPPVVQIVNLREHSKVTKEGERTLFVDEDPDEPKQDISGYPVNIPDISDIPETSSKPANSARKGSERSGQATDDTDTKESSKKEAVTEETVKKDRDSSGATSFNDPEQIKEVMEAAEARRQNPPYEFPPIDLLKKGEKSKGTSRSELDEMAQKLQSTLESFGVHVKVGDATCGPTVTRYELYPEQGVKVKTITALSDDIKLALAVPDIRIEAPIPGKAAVGIEVPNKTTTPVSLRELIDSDEFRNMKSRLAFAVGKDIGGKIICSDIASMPHALVAGSTGSGKSVCINAMILSILYKAKPSEVRLILIDPKRVELVGYNGIPHLLVPVVTDVKKATGALNWAVAEMDDRYNRFADVGVNNIASYNRLMEEKYFEEGGTADECPDTLPQILIIIDEFCDLMMTGNAKEVEASVARLTQLARACGIHLVIATQRPAVNVITGTIKANIPSRISFSLTSVVDSRTILDQAGAEKLLGKGDMLFSPQGFSQPVRLQGAYVSDKEIAGVVKYIKERCKEAMYNDAVSKHIESAASESKATDAVNDNNGRGAEDDYDELFEEAGKLIIDSKKASIGAIQRRFRVGFNRAARIMDQLAEAGVVGQDEGTKPRSILMTSEQFEAYLSGEDSGNTEEDDGSETPEENSGPAERPE